MENAAPEPAPVENEQSGESPRAHADLRLGQLPAHLQVRRVLGEGGSSVVYEAFHARLKVLVAVKVLSVQHPHARRRMLREAELYALLDEPRIPRVYDVDDLPDGTPFVVMEMVPGQSLDDLIRERGALPPSLAIDITKQVLATLAAVHARGVLHRDVKPANVILNFEPDGTCKLRLVDFGIAKMPSAEIGQEVVTQRGALVGTPQYMAPERLQGQEADASADTYGAGVMLYEMLAGAAPFDGSSVSAIVVAVLRESPAPLSAREPGVSPELEQLIMRAMARDPERRFASASAMLEALAELEREPEALASVEPEPAREAPLRLALELERPTLPAPPARKSWRRRGWLVAAIAIAALDLVLGLRLVQRASAPPPLAASIEAREELLPPTPPRMQRLAPEGATREPKEQPAPPMESYDAVPQADAVPQEESYDAVPQADAVLQTPVPLERNPRQTTIDYAELLPDNPY